MRTIGLIGGMSWESSAEYYRLLNGLTRERLGGHHCAPSVMITVDFAEIEAMQRADDWQGAAERLAEAAVGLERAGAELVVLCTNTMHRVADDIAAAIRIPFVDIVDVTAERILAAGSGTVGLLGTRFTMEGGFYRARMAAHGIEVLVPEASDRALVHDVIYRELTRGVVRDSSRQEFRRIIGDLAERGADGVVLGCTEIPLLIGPADTPVHLFDTTRLHVEHAVELALAAPDAVPGGTSAPARPAATGGGACSAPG
ncbi:aspartate/glutamate racemase family protein [Nocardia sp. NPDC101769]|uniref:aspartate/glutamate racemase family protein n=1 Tax=Nocardia sp. NPDC101769 TaxID=3364333 RepID=UPI0037F5AA08